MEGSIEVCKALLQARSFSAAAIEDARFVADKLGYEEMLAALDAAALKLAGRAG